MDDETLYGQVLKGDEAAFIELVQRYHSPLYKYLARFTGDLLLAEDLVQETFKRLLTYRGEVPTRFKPWVYRIATNIARDHFRSKAARHAHTIGLDERADSIADPHDFNVGNEIDVMAALAKLTPEHREVIILRFYHDLKLDEIAEVTGMPIGTMKSRLFHALRRLKGFLAITEVSYDR